MSHTVKLCECGKRCYSSKDAAKRAVRRMHQRVRPYWCARGQTWHVAKEARR